MVAQDGGLKVTWSPHIYESRPAVTHYLVQWRAHDQDFDTSRQALVSETSDLSHTIAGLTDGLEHFVRVVAVNDGSTDQHVDNDGHSRAVEVSAVPGMPGAPGPVLVLEADHQVILTWTDPSDSEMALSGYVVEWKSGDQNYDTSRKIEVSAGDARTAFIADLSNSVIHSVRITAVSTAGVLGVPKEVTAVPKGPPEPPSAVQAVGGRNSLLVSWDIELDGSPWDGYVIQWRTRDSYEPGSEELVMAPRKRSHVVDGLPGHGRFYVRVMARNHFGRSEPSEEFHVMSGAPHPPVDFRAEVNPAGGFHLTWDRPDPYYPNNPHYRPVRNFKTKKPRLDADGNTVPQYRYDAEYKRADGQSGGWCSQDHYRDKGVGNDTLNSNALTLDVTRYCRGAEPAAGERYNFRIRASYVWRNTGDTNWRNGPWVYSGHVEYNPTVYNQN